MIKKFLGLSTKLQILIMAVPVIVLGTVVGAITSNGPSNGPELITDFPQNILVENTVIENIIENEVSAIENIVEEVEEKEEVVKYKDKEIVIPKSKVSAAKSAEDAETSKKTGGSNVSQEQAQTMFENVGQKSMGIDVSQHQGSIDWASVRASGVEFAIIRVGYRGQTAGGIYEDRNFKANMNGAISNGIKVGVYFYSTAVNETEALEEAAWVVKKIAPYSITYPVVYDFEDFNAHRCANVGGEQATKNALAYLNYVRSSGYEPMMYANKNDITKRMSRGSFGCKFWLAHYVEQTDYTGNVNMWQYTCKGSVPGIAGHVDMNVAYFNYGTVAAPKHTHDFKEEVKNSYKAPTCEEKGTKIMACSCGEKETKEIEAVGHKWGAWKITVAPTSKKDGEQVRVCDTCKKEEKEVVKKGTLLDNTISNAVTNAVTNTVENKIENTVENKVGNAVNNVVNNTVTNTVENTGKNEVTNTVHICKFGEANIVENATCNKPGKSVAKCTDESCDKTQEKIIEATGNHNYVDGACSVCGKEDPDYEKVGNVVQ